MAQDADRRRIWQLFAELLSYPFAEVNSTAQECRVLLSDLGSPAERPMTNFADFIETTSLQRLQEIYTTTFDLDASCHPYIGHHIFGESYKRSAFMLGLKERYQDCGFEFVETELPDHVGVVIGFLAVSLDETISREIIQDALLPGLDRMLKVEQAESPDGSQKNWVSGNGYQPYRWVLEALRGILVEAEEVLP